MYSKIRLLFLIVSVVTCFPFARRQSVPQHAECRFSHGFSSSSLIQNSADFEDNIFYWDGQFHQDGVGYHQATGTTIDHVLLGFSTGLPGGPSSMISNARNEAYHIMLLTHAIAGNNHARTFVHSANPAEAAERAAAILNTKLVTYLDFNNTYPAYGGFLPMFQMSNTTIWPTDVSNHTVLALENGLLVWAVYSLIQVLQTSKVAELNQMAFKWATWFLYLRKNVRSVFFHGPSLLSICAVSTLLPETHTYASPPRYGCEDDASVSGPYSEELMAWFLYFSGSLNKAEGQALWDVRRPQLRAINYTGSIVDTSTTRGGLIDYTGQSIVGRHILPITTQQGQYFGSQEQLKLLFLPYLDVPIVARVMKNAERVRTCNSALMNKTPGLFAAVTDVTSPPTSEGFGYISTAGIPSIAMDKLQEQDVITPYAAFPAIMFDRGVGLSWYHNVLDARCMQSVYGSVNAIRRDGSALSRIVSWEAKAPVLLALLGGITDFVRSGMNRDGVLTTFIDITMDEYSMVFDETRNGGQTLMGEDVDLCLPRGKVSVLGLRDFSSCSSTDGL